MEVLVSVSTVDNAANARIVEALVSASTVEYAANARIVEAVVSVSTVDNAANARIVEALVSVSTVKYAANARLVVRGESEKRPRWRLSHHTRLVAPSQQESLRSQDSHCPSGWAREAK